MSSVWWLNLQQVKEPQSHIPLFALVLLWRVWAGIINKLLEHIHSATPVTQRDRTWRAQHSREGPFNCSETWPCCIKKVSSTLCHERHLVSSFLLSLHPLSCQWEGMFLLLFFLLLLLLLILFCQEHCKSFLCRIKCWILFLFGKKFWLVPPPHSHSIWFLYAPLHLSCLISQSISRSIHFAFDEDRSASPALLSSIWWACLCWCCRTLPSFLSIPLICFKMTFRPQGTFTFWQAQELRNKQKNNCTIIHPFIHPFNLPVNEIQ